MVSRVKKAIRPLSAMGAKTPTRHESGVGGAKITCGGASAGSTGVSSDSGFCINSNSADEKESNPMIVTCHLANVYERMRRKAGFIRAMDQPVGGFNTLR